MKEALSHFQAMPARLGLRAIVTAALTGFAGCAVPPPEVKTAAQWQAMCSVCHGPDGTSQSARSPVLAGQQQAYLSEQLRAFRGHARGDANGRTFMWPLAAGLTDPMIENLATHFASLPPLPAQALPSSGTAEVAEGKALYAQGPCSSCHGDKGQGVAPFPRLAGQHADYTRSQLAAYADDSRPHAVMGPMAKSITAPQAQSIAAFLAAQP